MVEVPLGQITMLLSDIQGSTRMAEALGDRWGAVLEAHHDLMRRAIESRGGSIEGREGDAVFALFPDAEPAVEAAVAAHAALGAHPWPPGHPVRVRMGLHSGSISRLPSGVCVGIEIHLAARVASAANVGQILLTQAVLAEVPGLHVEDLGLHRLKDFPAPQRLFHVVIDAVPAPMPRTLSARPTNLPTDIVEVVGREQERARIEELLDQDERLVTLTGPGGAGKTSLALAVAHECLEGHRGGVFFVALGGLDDPGSLLPAVAGALDVEQQAGVTLIDAVTDRIGADPTLLVLDNAEHIVDAVAGLAADLLSRSPGARLLVTSQAPLRLSREQILPVAGLDLAASVQLFTSRVGATATSISPDDLPTVEGICQRLDGLPLAVELAAARVPALGLEGLAGRIDDSLAVLARGPRDLPDRQRSLRATLEWTCDLLGPDASALLERTSVFAGPVGLDDLEALCGTDIDVLEALVELVELSLVRRREDLEFGVRYLLPEAVRQFAAERVGDPDGQRRRHAGYLAEVAWDVRLWVFGPPQESRRRLLALAAEERPALAWSRQADPGLHLRLVGGLGTSWLFRARPLEAIEHLRHAVEVATGESDDLLWARGVLAHALTVTGGVDEAVALADGIVEARRRRGDTRELSLALNVRAFVRDSIGDHRGGIADAEEANEWLRRTGDDRLRLRGLVLLATKLTSAADPEPVEALLDEAEPLAVRSGTPLDVAYVRDMRTGCALLRGDYETVRQLALEQARTARAHPELQLHGVMALETLAFALMGQEHAEAGLAVWGAHTAALDEIGYAAPASHWQAVTGALLESTRVDVGPRAAELVGEGAAVESRRRLGWAIERAEQAATA